MRGAIAAGHPLTAEAGARVLAEGGKAVDACIAAAFVAAVAEGPLTGPAGGGFLLVHEAGAESAVVLDCFFAAPSRTLGVMEEVVVDFADSGTQVFHVGEGSVAVPGLVAGLEEAHRRYGSRRWEALVQPALELAREGVVPDAPRALLYGVLSEILLRTPAGARVYGNPGRVGTQEFVATLERVRDVGSRAVPELIPELADDLAAYRVIERTPLIAMFGACGCSRRRRLHVAVRSSSTSCVRSTRSHRGRSTTKRTPLEAGTNAPGTCRCRARRTSR